MAQAKLIAKWTSGKTMNWNEYCKICGDGVLVDNYMEAAARCWQRRRRRRK